MLNRVVLVGRLTRNPELQYTPAGNAVARFTVACNRPFSNQQGEREADFINCITWRKQAENLASYMNKGSLIGLEGRIQTRNFENNEGRRIFITEVVADSIQFLENKNSNNKNTNNHSPEPSASPDNKPPNDDTYHGDPVDIHDEDLPF